MGSSVDLPRIDLRPAVHSPLLASLAGWASRVGPFWAASVAGHLAVFVLLALVLSTVHVAKQILHRTEITVQPVETTLPDEPPLQALVIGEPTFEPTVLDTKSLIELDPPSIDDGKPDPEIGPGLPGLGGREPTSIANTLDRLAQVELKVKADDQGSGSQTDGQPGGPSTGGNEFDRRKELIKGGRDGRTPQTERAVAVALNWFARHQATDGGWSLGDFDRQCKDHTCTGAGKIRSDSAATAFAMLPFLAAGQTHTTKGPYQKAVYGGLFWLVKHQGNDGNLGAGSSSLMYSHGLATITLCEAYGLTKDKQIGAAAQSAIKFIEDAQNKDDGGWRYTPGQPGDTSVAGWQIMALKSGLMAGLKVDRGTLKLAKHYLALAAGKSQQGGLFGYLPESAPTPTMTAVGLLCSQYMGTKRDDGSIAEGEAYIMKRLPDNGARNSYYWYYATQAMHNLPGPDWDTWNRQMRRTLIETQVKEGCAAGSWDPHKPAPDGHAAETGGRIMTTSLACLTLEVYYRYLPLYQLEQKAAGEPAKQQ